VERARRRDTLRATTRRAGMVHFRLQWRSQIASHKSHNAQAVRKYTN